jgi:transglutaminase-like putative cysteine protease
MRLTIEALLDYEVGAPADILLAVEVAQLPDQILVSDALRVTGVDELVPISGEESIGRRTCTHAAERLTVNYVATVDVERPAPALDQLACDDLRRLPALVVPYLFPSRYCEADKFRALMLREFGDLAGGARVQAIADWIGSHIDYVSGCSDETTTAADVFMSRKGVCRDFAHLMIAMIRATDIPARMVSAYAWDLKPQDFHAVVEVWLEGAWRLVDPSRLAPVEGLVRIGVGRDATDISFLTVFGQAKLLEQKVAVVRLDNP